MKRFLIVIVLAGPAAGVTHWSHVDLRGTQQDVLHLPAPASGRSHISAAILFLPGDGGWRGAAKEMASTMANSGYDVYVWDTKHYLASFTAKQGALKEGEIGSDFAAMRRALVPDAARTVILTGWSQGAAMSAVAAASPEGKQVFAGVILLALPDSGVLAWRWKDNFASLTGRAPNEPSFRTEPYLSHLSPLPTAVLQAGRDRFTAAHVSRQLLSHLRRPHRIHTFDEAGHDFGPDRSAFYRALNLALEWIDRREHRRHAPVAVPGYSTRSTTPSLPTAASTPIPDAPKPDRSPTSRTR